MISKELLSEVLDMEIADIPPKDKNSKFVYYRELSLITHSINIHELAHLCKAWAWDKHRQVVSSMIDERTARTPDEKTQWYASCTSYYEASLDGMYADREPEAIIKTCEWVYKNCKKDN